MRLTLITDQPTTTKLNVEENCDRGNIILDAVNATPIPLDRAMQPSPGAYLLLYHGALDLYRAIRQPTHPGLPGSIVEQGGRPIYAGSAFNLAERTQCHRLKLQRLGGRPAADAGADNVRSRRHTPPSAPDCRTATRVVELDPRHHDSVPDDDDAAEVAARRSYAETGLNSKEAALMWTVRRQGNSATATSKPFSGNRLFSAGLLSPKWATKGGRNKNASLTDAAEYDLVLR